MLLFMVAIAEDQQLQLLNFLSSNGISTMDDIADLKEEDIAQLPLAQKAALRRFWRSVTQADQNVAPPTPVAQHNVPQLSINLTGVAPADLQDELMKAQATAAALMDGDVACPITESALEHIGLKELHLVEVGHNVPRLGERF